MCCSLPTRKKDVAPQLCMNSPAPIERNRSRIWAILLGSVNVGPDALAKVGSTRKIATLGAERPC